MVAAKSDQEKVGDRQLGVEPDPRRRLGGELLCLSQRDGQVFDVWIRDLVRAVRADPLPYSRRKRPAPPGDASGSRCLEPRRTVTDTPSVGNETGSFRGRGNQQVGDRQLRSFLFGQIRLTIAPSSPSSAPGDEFSDRQPFIPRTVTIPGPVAATRDLLTILLISGPWDRLTCHLGAVATNRRLI